MLSLIGKSSSLWQPKSKYFLYLGNKRLKSYLGCNGASPEAYPKWVVNKKLLHETTYGYVAAQSTYKCPTDKTYWKPGSKVTSYGMGKNSSF